MSEPYKGLDAALARSAAPAERFATVLAGERCRDVHGDTYTAPWCESCRGWAAHVAAALAVVADDGLAVSFAVRPDWPTPNHCRRTADALDAITPARYGDILRAYAGAEDARSDTHGPIRALLSPAPSADRDERDRPYCLRCEVPIYQDDQGVWRREATGSQVCPRNPAVDGHEPRPDRTEDGA